MPVSSADEAKARANFSNDVFQALQKYHFATGGRTAQIPNEQARRLLLLVAELYR
jgi:hypothetical protein